MSLFKTLLSEVSQFLGTAIDQITSRSTPGTSHRRSDSSDVSFTKHFYSVAKREGLTEADARDVYYSGHASKYKTKWLQDQTYKNYNGYRITINYFKDSRTGKPVISSIWKKTIA